MLDYARECYVSSKYMLSEYAYMHQRPKVLTIAKEDLPIDFRFHF
jgi:hypothetical protein